MYSPVFLREDGFFFACRQEEAYDASALYTGSRSELINTEFTPRYVLYMLPAEPSIERSMLESIIPKGERSLTL